MLPICRFHYPLRAPPLGFRSRRASPAAHGGEYFISYFSPDTLFHATEGTAIFKSRKCLRRYGDRYLIGWMTIDGLFSSFQGRSELAHAVESTVDTSRRRHHTHQYAESAEDWPIII